MFKLIFLPGCKGSCFETLAKVIVDDAPYALSTYTSTCFIIESSQVDRHDLPLYIFVGSSKSPSPSRAQNLASLNYFPRDRSKDDQPRVPWVVFLDVFEG